MWMSIQIDKFIAVNSLNYVMFFEKKNVLIECYQTYELCVHHDIEFFYVNNQHQFHLPFFQPWIEKQQKINYDS